ncbi:MAG: hypothetical protein F4Y24_13315 [Gemmatimonadetes bacterium]|nr:hypothetical protein [Gemmatimonadota bacterium]MYG21623.1 hypothetical protein [Gemmatimonadota bacterium]MYJ37859.1 hypothetical protein [Gemmatimonadota bacterium]
MRKGSIGLAAGSLVIGTGLACRAAPDNEPAPGQAAAYELVEGWGGAREDVGTVTAVDVDDDGNVYAFRRDANDVWKLDADGTLLEQWDQDFDQWAHGIRVGPDGSIWTVDGQGHQVKKWSHDGRELLMTLGEYGVAGETPDLFNRPTDVGFGPDGEFFVSDGYGNNRVAKYDRNGEFIMAWGEAGTEPGQFNLPHTIVVDARNRVFVGDRENARIQIFDLDGNLLEIWEHLGSPYGLSIDGSDQLYVADLVNARIWIARASDGELLRTIDDTKAIHWVAADRLGNVYASTPAPSTGQFWDDPSEVWYLRKYQKVEDR